MICANEGKSTDEILPQYDRYMGSRSWGKSPSLLGVSSINQKITVATNFSLCNFIISIRKWIIHQMKSASHSIRTCLDSMLSFKFTTTIQNIRVSCLNSGPTIQFFDQTILLLSEFTDDSGIKYFLTDKIRKYDSGSFVTGVFSLDGRCIFLDLYCLHLRVR